LKFFYNRIEHVLPTGWTKNWDQRPKAGLGFVDGCRPGR